MNSYVSAMNMTMWICYMAGILTCPAFLASAYIGRAAMWAWLDARDAYRRAGLKPGYSKWHWLWILPKLAWRTFCKTLWRDLNGMRRTG